LPGQTQSWWAFLVLRYPSQHHPYSKKELSCAAFYVFSRDKGRLLLQGIIFDHIFAWKLMFVGMFLKKFNII
jgi:hypothetical protein